MSIIAIKGIRVETGYGEVDYLAFDNKLRLITVFFRALTSLTLFNSKVGKGTSANFYETSKPDEDHVGYHRGVETALASQLGVTMTASEDLPHSHFALGTCETLRERLMYLCQRVGAAYFPCIAVKLGGKGTVYRDLLNRIEEPVLQVSDEPRYNAAPHRFAGQVD